MNCNETLEWLDAYIDGELDLPRQLAMDQHMNGCRTCAQSMSERKSLQRAFRAADLRVQPPAGMEARLRHALTPRHAQEFVNWRDWWGGFFSAAALAGVMALVGSNAMVLTQDQRLAQIIVDTHVRALMTHHLVDVATSNQHVVKPWFNGRIDFSPSVHDFADRGFPLEGGRVDAVNGRSVAVLVYHRALHPIQLFMWPTPRTTSVFPRQFTRNGYHMIRWADRAMTYWAISDLNAKELNDFAEMLKLSIS